MEFYLLRTPSSLHAYSVLLLNTAIVDWTASIVSLSIAMRLVQYHCHLSSLLHRVFFGLLGHSYVLLLISLAYRLWSRLSSHFFQNASTSVESCNHFHFTQLDNDGNIFIRTILSGPIVS